MGPFPISCGPRKTGRVCPRSTSSTGPARPGHNWAAASTSTPRSPHSASRWASPTAFPTSPGASLVTYTSSAGTAARGGGRRPPQRRTREHCPRAITGDRGRYPLRGVEGARDRCRRREVAGIREAMERQCMGATRRQPQRGRDEFGVDPEPGPQRWNSPTSPGRRTTSHRTPIRSTSSTGPEPPGYRTATPSTTHHRSSVPGPPWRSAARHLMSPGDSGILASPWSTRSRRSSRQLRGWKIAPRGHTEGKRKCSTAQPISSRGIIARIVFSGAPSMVAGFCPRTVKISTSR